MKILPEMCSLATLEPLLYCSRGLFRRSTGTVDTMCFSPLCLFAGAQDNSGCIYLGCFSHSIPKQTQASSHFISSSITDAYQTTP